MATLFSMGCHLVFTHCRPMDEVGFRLPNHATHSTTRIRLNLPTYPPTYLRMPQPEAQLLQHVAYGLTTLNYAIGLMLKVGRAVARWRLSGGSLTSL